MKKQNVMQKYDLITKEPIFQKFKTNNKQLVLLQSFKSTIK
ncbi:hypothetical protein [Lactococcus lactis]|nr:hypothetical protein [Lactococcus lactis]